MPFGDDFEERIKQVLPDKTEPAGVYCFDADYNATPILAPLEPQMTLTQEFSRNSLQSLPAT